MNSSSSNLSYFVICVRDIVCKSDNNKFLKIKMWSIRSDFDDLSSLIGPRMTQISTIEMQWRWKQKTGYDIFGCRRFILKFVIGLFKQRIRIGSKLPKTFVRLLFLWYLLRTNSKLDCSNISDSLKLIRIPCLNRSNIFRQSSIRTIC